MECWQTNRRTLVHTITHGVYLQTRCCNRPPQLIGWDTNANTDHAQPPFTQLPCGIRAASLLCYQQLLEHIFARAH